MLSRGCTLGIWQKTPGPRSALELHGLEEATDQAADQQILCDEHSHEKVPKVLALRRTPTPDVGVKGMWKVKGHTPRFMIRLYCLPRSALQEEKGVVPQPEARPPPHLSFLPHQCDPLDTVLSCSEASPENCLWSARAGAS